MNNDREMMKLILPNVNNQGEEGFKLKKDKEKKEKEEAERKREEEERDKE